MHNTINSFSLSPAIVHISTSYAHRRSYCKVWEGKAFPNIPKLIFLNTNIHIRESYDRKLKFCFPLIRL
jgi:hypothetical protein